MNTFADKKIVLKVVKIIVYLSLECHFLTVAYIATLSRRNRPEQVNFIAHLSSTAENARLDVKLTQRKGATASRCFFPDHFSSTTVPCRSTMAGNVHVLFYSSSSPPLRSDEGSRSSGLSSLTSRR